MSKFALKSSKLVDNSWTTLKVAPKSKKEAVNTFNSLCSVFADFGQVVEKSRKHFVAIAEGLDEKLTPTRETIKLEIVTI